MTVAVRRPPGVHRWSTYGALVLLTGTVMALAPAASADSHAPKLQLRPPAGGPGTMVTVHGTGFCTSAGCSGIRLLLAGRPVGEPQQVTPAGTFTMKFQAPGGQIAGDLEVTAAQTASDGVEQTAVAFFTYSPSRGEETERKAEERDALTHLANPKAPKKKATGKPFTAILDNPAPSSTPAAAPESSPSSRPALATATGGSDDGDTVASGQFRAALGWLLGGSFVVLLLFVLSRRRVRWLLPATRSGP